VPDDGGKTCKEKCAQNEACDAWEFGKWSNKVWCAIWKKTPTSRWGKDDNRLNSGVNCKGKPDDGSCGTNGNNWGPGISNIKAGSACLCAEACDADDLCGAWTYVPNGQFNMGTDDCVLRSKFAGMIDNCGGTCRSGATTKTRITPNTEHCTVDWKVAECASFKTHKIDIDTLPYALNSKQACLCLSKQTDDTKKNCRLHDYVSIATLVDSSMCKAALADSYVRAASTGGCAEGKMLNEDECRDANANHGEWKGSGTFTSQTCGCFVNDKGERFFNKKLGETGIVAKEKKCGAPRAFRHTNELRGNVDGCAKKCAEHVTKCNFFTMPWCFGCENAGDTLADQKGGIVYGVNVGKCTKFGKGEQMICKA